MALGATVYKATIDVSDLDRDSYGNYVLTIARHPSETEERLMLRVLAFCRLAGERLEFGRGLSTLKTVESTLSQIRRRRARGTSGLWPSSP